MDAPLSGPYKLIEKMSDVVFRLQMVTDPSQCITIHASRAVPFYLRSDVTGEDIAKLQNYDQEECIVEKVITHEGTTRSDIRFRLRWKGFDASADTYESWKNVCKNGVITAPVFEYLHQRNALLKTLKVKD